jgi:hypothetical protein
MTRSLLLTLALCAGAACMPAAPTPAPAPDPVLTARIDALEARQTQLLVAIARLEERLALAKGEAVALPGGRTEPSPTSAMITPPASAPAAPASAPQRGPKGGCYVVTASGKKRYVSRDRC